MGSGGGGYADWTQGYEINGKELIVTKECTALSSHNVFSKYKRR
jgi:hypothetical protein